MNLLMCGAIGIAFILLGSFLRTKTLVIDWSAKKKIKLVDTHVFQQEKSQKEKAGM